MREHRSRGGIPTARAHVPREFRERFAADLEIDFLEMARTRGRAFAWRRALTDLCRSVPLTASDAAAERARTARIRGPIVPPGETAMRSLLFDLRHGLRALVRAPAFTLVTILTLALGIGANSAIFTLVNAALMRPPGFADPERLMLVYEAIPPSGVERSTYRPPIISTSSSISGPSRQLARIAPRPQNCRAEARRNRSTRPRSPRRCSARSASTRPRGAPFSPKRINSNRTSRSSATPLDAALWRPFAARVGDRPRSQAVHGGWGDAGRIRIPAPRRIVERDSRGRLVPLVFTALEKQAAG